MDNMIQFPIDNESIARLYVLSTRRDGSFYSVQRFIVSICDVPVMDLHEMTKEVHDIVRYFREVHRKTN